MCELLAYGGGALGLVGVFFFIIKYFFGKDEDEEIVKGIEKEKEKKIKEHQKEIDKQKKKLDDLDKKSKDIQKKIDDTMEKVKEEKEKIDKSDSVEKTVNMIEKEW